MSDNLKPLENLVNQVLKDSGEKITLSSLQKAVSESIKGLKNKKSGRISRNDIIAVVFNVMDSTLKKEQDEEKAEIFNILGDNAFSKNYYKAKTQELEKVNKKLQEQQALIAKQSYEIAKKGFFKTSAVVIGVLVVGLILIKLLTRLIFKENVKISDILLFRTKNVFNGLKSKQAKIFVAVGITTVILMAVYIAKKRLKVNDELINAAIEGATKAEEQK